AYLLSFRLLGLRPGDRLVELGSGSGYGAALAATIVGPAGWVRTIEIDPKLTAWAQASLHGLSNVSVIHGDAVKSAGSWDAPNRVVCTFAVREIPVAWVEALPEGAVLVAPVGPTSGDQRLVRVAREDGRLVTTEHGAVRYVPNRSNSV